MKKQSNDKKDETQQVDQLRQKALGRAIISERLEGRIDFRHFNRNGSPVYSPWENILPPIFLMLLTLFLLLTKGLVIGVVSLIWAGIVHVLIVKYWLVEVVARRVMRDMASDYKKFEDIWKYGGVKLVLRADRHVYCEAPKGDWKNFSSRYFSDLMVEAPPAPPPTPSNQEEMTVPPELEPDASTTIEGESADKTDPS